ncbi:TetR/AcrR family transcriptional regulator [Kineococcus sp. SYSU DK002]|uniref:TetR/AcrR family transcriptional regulator n=1 Tax=Kineococcus sp. SYSU DK002 TaxID=3383123 RepID=UPI003D7C78D2
MDAGGRTPGSRLGRRNDPDRRDRIIDACLEVVSRAGVAGTSHRKVAAEAGVPLGATTYYFEGMDDLLAEAFTRFATTVSDRFERRMAAAADPDAARGAVVAIVLEGVLGDDRELVLSHELHTLAAREPAYRSITTAWVRRNRAALGRHFDPVTVRALDALIEGLTTRRALDREARDPGEVALAVARITRDDRPGPAPAGA